MPRGVSRGQTVWRGLLSLIAALAKARKDETPPTFTVIITILPHPVA